MWGRTQGSCGPARWVGLHRLLGGLAAVGALMVFAVGEGIPPRAAVAGDDDELKQRRKPLPGHAPSRPPAPSPARHRAREGGAVVGRSSHARGSIVGDRNLRVCVNASKKRLLVRLDNMAHLNNWSVDLVDLETNLDFQRSSACFSLEGNMIKGSKHEDAAAIFDKLVFAKVTRRFGGRVRVILSGAAPLSNHVEEFLCVVICSHALFIDGQGNYQVARFDACWVPI